MNHAISSSHNYKKLELNDININIFESVNLDNLIINLLSDNTSSQFITLNLDFLRISESNSEFKSICRSSNIIVPDGVGVIFLLKLKYRGKIAKVTGNDIFNSCLDIANRISLKVGTVGGSEYTINELNKRIKNKYPNINLKSISPKLNFETDPEVNKKVVDEMKNFSPDMLFVAMGCPRQEKWIHAHKNDVGAKINVGVGAVFDFYTGTKRRAPQIFIDLWLEWFWGMLHEPLRLGKRYLLLDVPFLIKMTFKVLFGLK